MMATEKLLIDLWGVNMNEVDTSDCTDVEDILSAVITYLSEQPTVDAVEVLHGQWVSDEGDVLFHCSECETQISTSWDYDDLQWNYCPNCGAKMDLKG
jgi:hypothetical protein